MAAVTDSYLDFIRNGESCSSISIKISKIPLVLEEYFKCNIIRSCFNQAYNPKKLDISVAFLDLNDNYYLT